MLAGHSVTSNSVSRECHRNISGRCELLFNPVFSRFKMLHGVAFQGMIFWLIGNPGLRVYDTDPGLRCLTPLAYPNGWPLSVGVLMVFHVKARTWRSPGSQRNEYQRMPSDDARRLGGFINAFLYRKRRYHPGNN